jgi:hypothetical protein
MRYMLLIYPADEPVDEERRQETRSAFNAFTRECLERGVYLAADPLHPAETARTVRVRSGERITTDGPFAETREWLAGYFMLDCASLDEALEFAHKLPLPGDGAVEVREVLEIPGVHTEYRLAQEARAS